MTKSSSYRETFREHRKLLVAPIVVAVLIAGWFVIGSAKSYQSTASLWVDSPAPVDSSLGHLNLAELPPAQQEQNVVTELLATRQFVLSVGHQSALAGYLSSNRSSGFGPTALLGGGGGNLDSKIIEAIGASQVTTSVPGPQVLQISYTGPTPTVAQSTLNAIVSQLQAESARFSHVHTQAAIDYYKGQVQAATQALSAARAQADTYRAQHPNAAPNDPNLSALATAEGSAGSQLTQANASLSAAASGLKAGSDGSAIQVIDPATVPTGPSSGKKKQVEGVLGGLLAGMLISFLGTVALTRGKSDPWEDEVAEGLAPAGDTLASPQPVASSGNGLPSQSVIAKQMPALVGGRRFAPVPLPPEDSSS